MPTSPTPSGQGGGNTDRPPPPTPPADAPLPSNSHPLALSCACLNVTVAARVPDILGQRVARGPGVFIQGKLESIWLPVDAEVVVSSHFHSPTLPRQRASRASGEGLLRLTAETPRDGHFRAHIPIR